MKVTYTDLDVSFWCPSCKIEHRAGAHNKVIETAKQFQNMVIMEKEFRDGEDSILEREDTKED